MAIKEIKTRIKQLHDSEAKWKSIENTFTPLAGEIIIYDSDENHTNPRIKVGDGNTELVNLEFITSEVDLSNYYTKEEITDLLAGIGSSIEGITATPGSGFDISVQGNSFNLDWDNDVILVWNCGSSTENVDENTAATNRVVETDADGSEIAYIN